MDPDNLNHELLDDYLRHNPPKPLPSPRLADDDILWVAKCNLPQLAALFASPVKWVSMMSRPDGKPFTLSPHFVIQIQVAHGAKFSPNFDVSGIDNTGVVMVRANQMPSLDDLVSMVARPDFKDEIASQYPDHPQKEAAVEMTHGLVSLWGRFWTSLHESNPPINILVDRGRGIGFGHMEITKRNDPIKGGKVSGFMICSPSHHQYLNKTLCNPANAAFNGLVGDDALIERGTYRMKPFESADQLKKVGFLYQGENVLDDTDPNPICEYASGSTGDTTEIALDTSVTKDYLPPDSAT